MTEVRIFKKIQCGLETYVGYVICSISRQILAQAQSMSYHGLASIIYDKKRKLERRRLS